MNFQGPPTSWTKQAKIQNNRKFKMYNLQHIKHYVKKYTF